MITAEQIKKAQISLIQKSIHCPKCKDFGNVVNFEGRTIPCREC